MTISGIRLGSDIAARVYYGSDLVFGGGEIVHDTYNLPAGSWRWASINSWWRRLHLGTWTSTSAAAGTYLTVDNSSQIQTGFLRLGSINQTLPTGAKMRCTVTPSTGGTKTLLVGTPFGGGDARFDWEDTLTVSMIENGGTLGWDQSDSVKFELFTP